MKSKQTSGKGGCRYEGDGERRLQVLGMKSKQTSGKGGCRYEEQTNFRERRVQV